MDTETSKTMEAQIVDFIDRALQEDVGDGDHTSLACIPEYARSKARLLVKDVGIIAGVEFASIAFRHLDKMAEVTIHKRDGTHVVYGDVAFEVECNTQALLKGERLILNTMQRMSGIATLTDRFVCEIEGLPVQVIDTRKTTPTVRFFEKWAVRIGGASNYRFGLYDRVMIKDNHIDVCGGIPQAIEQVYNYQKTKGLNLEVTIEVRNLGELYEVLEVGDGRVHRIMFDNFELPILREAVAAVGDRFEMEASGGVNIQTVGAIARTGVNYISVGSLTHSFQSLDMSLKIFK